MEDAQLKLPMPAAERELERVGVAVELPLPLCSDDADTTPRDALGVVEGASVQVRARDALADRVAGITPAESYANLDL
jgi:hypothetical protein